MDDKAVKAGDALEKALQRRLTAIYQTALRTALDRQEAFLELVKAVQEGRIKPDDYYDTPEKVARWKQRFLIEAARQQRVIDDIAEELAKAGKKAGNAIKRVMPEVYEENRTYVLDQISGSIRDSFYVYDRKQLDVILKDEQSPFSKIAYQNLGKKKPVVQRLGAALAVSTVTGESQTKLIERIKTVTGQSILQAYRVAQTERTRVQSQARADAIHEAAQLGVVIEQEWSARMVNTRDAHEFLNGQRIKPGETFSVDGAHDVLSRSRKRGMRTGGGYEIAYPGDPNAPARAVINCRCVLIPRVMLPGAVNQINEREELMLSTETNAGVKGLTKKENSGIITSSGAVPLSLRFLNKLDPLARNAKNIEPLPEYEDIVVHGDKTGFAFNNPDGETSLVNVHEFAAMLKKSDLYHRGSIRLISCETGAEGAITAQLLADDLGVNVLAPTDVLWVLESGKMVIGPDPHTNSGEWRLFKPERK